MSSDDAYMSFLDKANADLNNARAERAQRQSTVRTEAVDIDVRVPAPLTSVDAYYVSETDEPFEPVTLKWEKAAKGIWPDPSMSFFFSFAFLVVMGRREEPCLFPHARIFDE